MKVCFLDRPRESGFFAFLSILLLFTVRIRHFEIPGRKNRKNGGRQRLSSPLFQHFPTRAFLPQLEDKSPLPPSFSFPFLLRFKSSDFPHLSPGKENFSRPFLFLPKRKFQSPGKELISCTFSPAKEESALTDIIGKCFLLYYYVHFG